MHYEITGKLRSSAWDDVLQRMDGANPTVPAQRINMSFETTAPTARAWTSNTLVETQANIHGVVTYLDSYDPKYASFELYSGQSLHSWDGYFRIRVRSSGDGIAERQKSHGAAEKGRPGRSSQDANGSSRGNPEKGKACVVASPGRVDELKDLAGSRLVSKLDEIIAQENINVVQLASMKLQSEYNGYITYVVPGLAKDPGKGPVQSMFTIAFPERATL